MNGFPDRLASALADRYRIERELGQGGMATVFLAADLKHDRKVAIKVLKPELAAVLGAERFVQEIKTTAALSHPHILPLFDSGQAGGRDGAQAGGPTVDFLYYVMPYVEGETLRERLNRETQLGVDEAVRIGTEVADALDYAHRHGVIHRDIKPENIMLHDGRPMVMDFGIALAVSAAAGGRMTETGLSLGTPHYMSPEQATADKDITARSDVYSLASVLYEMLAGQPPHVGGSAQQVIMRIIADVPRPVTELRKSVPPHVAAALERALEKVPADRFATAREFSEALQGRGYSATTASRRGTAAAGTRSLARSPIVLGLGAAVVGLLGLVAWLWPAAHRTPAEPRLRFHLDMAEIKRAGNTGRGTEVAVSSDGLTIAWSTDRGAGDGGLFVRRLEDAEPRAIAGTTGGHTPVFSPDGQWVAYMVGGTLWKVPVSGEAPVQLGVFGDEVPTGLTWSPSGNIICGTGRGLVAIPAGGGAPRVVAPLDSASGDKYFNQPRALEDGETVVFAIQREIGPTSSRLASLSLKTGKVTRYDLSLVDPLAVKDGTLVYSLLNGALMAVGVDLRKGKLTSDPVALGVTVAIDIAIVSQAAVSNAGTLVYSPPATEGSLGWVNSDGRFEPLLKEPGSYAFPRLSPDGRKLAFTNTAAGRTDVYTWDFASATTTRVTSTGFANDRPEWTPDGRRLLFRVSGQSSNTSIWWQPADLSAPAEPLEASTSHAFYEGIMAPDGETFLYQMDDAGAQQADIMLRRIEGDTTSRPVAASGASEAQARVSPDGKWVVYVSDASGRSEVVVQPFPDGGGRVQVSNAGGSEPVWSHDGRRIFYRDGREVIAASVTATPAFSVTGRSVLFQDTYIAASAPHPNFDVSADGKRLIMVRATKSPELQVVYGWWPEVKARMLGR